MAMKRTCFGCRALEAVDALRYRCQLRKSIKYGKTAGGFPDPRPAEECLKPRTIPAFLVAYKALA